MTEPSEDVIHCHSCGSAMDVSELPPFSNAICPNCGSHTRVKCEFGPYTLLRRHAIGGMSMVFVAKDNTLDREVVVKILSEEYSADERRIAAFEEEARITASFNHPNVVRVLRTGRAFGRFYIAMELIPGGHFEHQINERKTIPEIEMLPLAIEVAQGLKAAHAAGLIHRDVKPGNILLDADGHAKLVDFGLALVTQGGLAQATELWATPYYVPPETIEGHSEDFRSDIYAFGATVYHALTGKPSCGEETMQTEVLRKAKKNVIPLSQAAPLISADTCAIIERAMAYNPENRFSSYDEMILSLEASLKRLKSGSQNNTEASLHLSRRRVKKQKIDRVIYTSVGISLLLTILGGTWWVRRKEPIKQITSSKANVSVTADSEASVSQEIANNYHKAHDAITAKDYNNAIKLFVKLSENNAVQEPTRTWAGIEAVVSNYLAGNTQDAKKLGKTVAKHAASVPTGPTRISNQLINLLETLDKLPAIPGHSLDAPDPDLSHIMAQMIAGLKDWDQGMLDDAGVLFTAVAHATLTSDGQWMKPYQELAQNYLDDQKSLSAPVFQKLPADKAACDAAILELEGILKTLKTRGRAHFNARAFQLDIVRHSKLLESANSTSKTEIVFPPNLPKKTYNPSVLIYLQDMINQSKPQDAIAYLKTLDKNSNGVERDSLIKIVQSSVKFLKETEHEFTQTVQANMYLKSGGYIVSAKIGPDGKIITIDTAGKQSPHVLTDFLPSTLIDLHRIFMKKPMPEPERISRHEYAIAFDWLMGDRTRALAAAASLSATNSNFKQTWQAIVSGLPR
jgi:serine/threonine protein kinase